ncbi:MAG: FHA domain-containing protein [Chitinophagaceae bacterium]
MKNIIEKIKKGFGIPPEERQEEQAAPAAQKEQASFIPSTRALRESIIGFITQSLQPYVDEKALSIGGLDFYIVCQNRQQEEAARVALYADKPGMFKTEHLERTLANHFIQTDPAWFFEWHIIKDQLPENCLQQNSFGLRISGAAEPVTAHYEKARIEILKGQAEQQEYTLDPQQQLKFYIGRSRMPQLATGKIQQNDIAFLNHDEPGFNEQTGGPNGRISRNHAYIVYDARTGSYLLFPDKGGLPDNGNKLKVHTSADQVKWLNIYGVSHCLCDGDQVELGGTAVLRFRSGEK